MNHRRRHRVDVRKAQGRLEMAEIRFERAAANGDEMRMEIATRFGMDAELDLLALDRVGKQPDQE